MNEKEIEEKALELLKDFPEKGEVHATEDGTMFWNKSYADDHNRKVVKKEVHSFYRNKPEAQPEMIELDQQDLNPETRKPGGKKTSKK